MSVKEIKSAVDNGLIVHWSNNSYTVIPSRGDYLIQHLNGSCTGLTWKDGVTLNGDEKEFYTPN